MNGISGLKKRGRVNEALRGSAKVFSPHLFSKLLKSWNCRDPEGIAKALVVSLAFL